MRDKRTWYLEDHLCRVCGARILRGASGFGPTGGGNPVFKCAGCGASTSAMGPEGLCWCGFSHRNNFSLNAYICQPFSILKERPELLNAFRNCGCEPGNGEVGILLGKDLYPIEK